MTLSGQRILLIIGGGIAAYKSLELIREIKKRGGAVRAILTKAGAEFVTPLLVASLAGEKVFSDLFSLTDEAEMGHIELSRAADLVVVAPATADLLAKMAQGLANDLASTALLATDKRVLVAPAMNVRMWTHPATQRNITQLQKDGVALIGPDDGEMACGEFGPGRMAEPFVIADAIEKAACRALRRWRFSASSSRTVRTNSSILLMLAEMAPDNGPALGRSANNCAESTWRSVRGASTGAALRTRGFVGTSPSNALARPKTIGCIGKPAICARSLRSWNVMSGERRSVSTANWKPLPLA